MASALDVPSLSGPADTAAAPLSGGSVIALSGGRFFVESVTNAAPAAMVYGLYLQCRAANATVGFFDATVEVTGRGPTQATAVGLFLSVPSGSAALDAEVFASNVTVAAEEATATGSAALFTLSGAAAANGAVAAVRASNVSVIGTKSVAAWELDALPSAGSTVGSFGSHISLTTGTSSYIAPALWRVRFGGTMDGGSALVVACSRVEVTAPNYEAGEGLSVLALSMFAMYSFTDGASLWWHRSAVELNGAPPVFMPAAAGHSDCGGRCAGLKVTVNKGASTGGEEDGLMGFRPTLRLSSASLPLPDVDVCGDLVSPPTAVAESLTAFAMASPSAEAAVQWGLGLCAPLDEEEDSTATPTEATVFTEYPKVTRFSSAPPKHGGQTATCCFAIIVSILVFSLSAGANAW